MCIWYLGLKKTVGDWPKGKIKCTCWAWYSEFCFSTVSGRGNLLSPGVAIWHGPKSTCNLSPQRSAWVPDSHPLSSCHASTRLKLQLGTKEMQGNPGDAQLAVIPLFVLQPCPFSPSSKCTYHHCHYIKGVNPQEPVKPVCLLVLSTIQYLTAPHVRYDHPPRVPGGTNSIIEKTLYYSNTFVKITLRSTGERLRWQPDDRHLWAVLPLYLSSHIEKRVCFYSRPNPPSLTYSSTFHLVIFPKLTEQKHHSYVSDAGDT